jgi:hypothetical protein
MNVFGGLRWTVLLWAVGLAGACSSSALEEHGVTEQMSGDVLAEVELGKNHRALFIQGESGQVALVESGEIGSTPLDLSMLSGLTLLEKYRALTRLAMSSENEPPAALVEANERSKVAAMAGDVMPPPAGFAEKLDASTNDREVSSSDYGVITSALIDYTADATWWRDNFCKSAGADGVWCPTNMAWANSGWEPTMYFESVCLAASESASATHWVEYWNGSSWARDWSVTFNPRIWWRYVDETVVNRRGGCEGLNPSPHVHYSHRIRWATPSFAAASDYPFNRSFEAGNGLQGVTHDSSNWYFTAAKKVFSVTSRIWKRAFTADLRYSPSLVANPWEGTYNHFGDPVYVGGRVYVPLEPSGGNGSDNGAIGVFDSNLNAIGYAVIPSASPQVSGSGGPASWVAYNPKDGYFYSSRYHTNKLHRYSIGVYSSAPRVRITYKDSIQIRDGNGNAMSDFGYVQGGKFSASGKLYMTRWLANGGIFVVDPNNGRYQKFIHVNYDKSDDEELEGLDLIDLSDGRAPGISSHVHVVMIQVEGLSNDDWYFKHFTVDNFSKL